MNPPPPPGGRKSPGLKPPGQPPPRTPAPGGPPPPPKMAPQLRDARENLLLDMQKVIVKFYLKHDPEKINSDVLCLAAQLWWDKGLVALNKILKKKYGAKLKLEHDFVEDFDRDHEDITLVNMVNVPDQAALKDHLVIDYFIKSNGADFFAGDSVKNKKKLAEQSLLGERNEKPMTTKQKITQIVFFEKQDDSNSDSSSSSDSSDSEYERKQRSKKKKKARQRDKKKKQAAQRTRRPSKKKNNRKVSKRKGRS